MDWAERAACKDKPSAWFFPDRTHDNYTQARKVCRDCPVQAVCLGEALTREAMYPYKGHRWGMWGGTSPEERDELMRTGRLVRRVA